MDGAEDGVILFCMGLSVSKLHLPAGVLQNFMSAFRRDGNGSTWTGDFRGRQTLPHRFWDPDPNEIEGMSTRLSYKLGVIVKTSAGHSAFLWDRIGAFTKVWVCAFLKSLTLSYKTAENTTDIGEPPEHLRSFGSVLMG